MKTVIIQVAFVFSMLSSTNACADLVRCDVGNRTHELMPSWIEYEFGLQGSVIEVRDSVGEQRGVGWVGGSILENTQQRVVFSWDTGVMSERPDWRRGSKVVMTMWRLPNGDVKVSGVPDSPKKSGEVYQGIAICDR